VIVRRHLPDSNPISSSPRAPRLCARFISRRSPKSLRHNLFGDHNPLTPIASIFYKKGGGRRATQHWSYLSTGTLPRPISFVCHSCENCRVWPQNSHSETVSLRARSSTHSHWLPETKAFLFTYLRTLSHFFASAKNLRPFVSNRFRTLRQKTEGRRKNPKLDVRSSTAVPCSTGRLLHLRVQPIPPSFLCYPIHCLRERSPCKLDATKFSKSSVQVPLAESLALTIP
jgi:hypothetical protein